MGGRVGRAKASAERGRSLRPSPLSVSTLRVSPPLPHLRGGEDRRQDVSGCSSTSKARPWRSCRISCTSWVRRLAGRWPGGRPGRSGQTRRVRPACCFLFCVPAASHSPRGPPAGEATGLSGQVVKCGTERLEAQRKAGRVERIVGRGRAARRDGKRRGDAGKRDARNAVRCRPLRPGAKGPERVEQRQGERARGRTAA